MLVEEYIMIHYKGKIFCPFWKLCKNGNTCDRALTKEVEDAAAKWWGGEDAPISLDYDFPDCFKRWFDEEI